MAKKSSGKAKSEVKVATKKGKFKLVHPDRIYLDHSTGISYHGDKTFEKEAFSAYENKNMADSKDAAIRLGKIFYKVD